jgi:hypothetical protein
MLPHEIFSAALRQFAVLLQKIQQHDGALLDSALTPDQFPLWQQAQTAIGFSLRACCPLADKKLPVFAKEKAGWPDLQQQIQLSLDYLSQFTALDFAGWQQKTVKTTAGFAELEMQAEQFLYSYALPNFYFHYSMVYAIARAQQLPLSKSDFDGWHQYPAGFSFLNQ